MEVLEKFGLDPATVVAGTTLSAILVFLLYRKFLVAAVEPLSLFMVVQIGDASVMSAMPLALSYKWQFFAYMLCLWAGFALKGKDISSGSVMVLDRNSLFDLTFVLTALCVLILGANLYLGATAGFPLLSENPTATKYQIYTGGLGFVRRVNSGPYNLLCAGCTLLTIIGHRRRYALTIVMLATLPIMLSGNKSALLPLILTFSFGVVHQGLSSQIKLRKTSQKYLLLLLGGGTAIALIITTKEQGNILAGFQAIVLRLLLAGDGIIFYYTRREVIMGLVQSTVTGYLHSVFNDVQGLLRLGNYEPAALGTLILGGEEGGPNVQYFLHADLFFGPIAGCIYSFTIGYIIAAMRNGFFSSRSKSAVWLSVRLFLAVTAFNLAIEASLFISECMVMILFLVPLYLFARYCRICLAHAQS